MKINQRILIIDHSIIDGKCFLPYIFSDNGVGREILKSSLGFASPLQKCR